MENLKEKYNIEETFYKRYFEQNAASRLTSAMNNFLLFKKGKFILPTKKDEHLKLFLKEEIENFY